MTGPEHYRAAESLVDGIGDILGSAADAAKHPRPDEVMAAVMPVLAAAQVHATLALAAATAYPAIKDYTGDEMGHESRGWTNATAPGRVSA